MRNPPADPGWFNEIKFDGYRLLAWKTRAGVRLMTRNGLDWADRLPAIVRWVAALPAAEAILDGELVALKPDGTTSFPELQQALTVGDDDRLYFYAFDLLAQDGWDLRGCSLRDRKTLLRNLDAWTGHLLYSEHVEGEPAELYQQATRFGLEGIVCKRNVPYHEDRNGDWVKVKALAREEMIVLGWTPPRGSRAGISLLHLGYYDPGGHLHYAGAVGAGFSNAMLQDWRAKLEPLAALPSTMLVAGEPIDAETQWVKPRLVVEVSYTAWSGAGRLCNPVYLGIRLDKTPREVVREIADPGTSRDVFAARRQAGRPGGSLGEIPPRRG